MNGIIEELKNDCNFPIGIPAAVWDYISAHAESYTKYCSYIQPFKDDMVERVYGYRRHHKVLEVNEVIRRTPLAEGCVMKDIYHTQMGGYQTMYEPKDRTSRYYGYNYTLFAEESFGKWGWESIGHGIGTVYINLEALKNIDKYRYCGYSTGNLMDYLAAYNKDSHVEYMGKLGLEYRPSLGNMVKKDRKFAKFLAANVKDVNLHGPEAAIYAYKHNISVHEAWNICTEQRAISRRVVSWIPQVKTYNLDRIKTDRYIQESCKGRYGSYRDYLTAVAALGLDLKDTKNIYPYNFSRMHDLRIDEYKALKAKEDEEKARKLCENFTAAARKAEGFAFTDGKYTVIIPQAPSDLVAEGESLHHCVGKMGYDLKMAEGRCVIAFVRLATEPDKPLVTVEWLTDKKKVAQCYADHDTKPAAEIVAFVDKWAEHVKEVIAA